MRLLAGVSHSSGIVQNYYARGVIGGKQINTKQFCRLINNVSVSYLLENSDEYCVSLYRTHYLTGIPETASTDFLIMCMRYDKTSGWVIVKDLQTSALYVITCVLGEYGKWTTIIS